MTMPWSKEFKEIFQKSGITTPYSNYVKRMAILVSVTCILTVFSYTIIHNFILGLFGRKLIPATASITLTTCSLISFILLYYPLYRKNQIRSEIEDGLVYTLSYMAVLSAGGIPLDRIMERVSEVEDTAPLKQLANKFMVNLKLLGFDVISALKDISFRSPSEIFSKLIHSINNTIQTRGDLKNLLTYEVGRQMQRKRDKMKKIMGTRNLLGEIYITMMVVAPILFIIMLTILSALGRGPSGVSSILQLNLLIFFGMPVMATGFLIVLDTIFEGDD